MSLLLTFILVAQSINLGVAIAGLCIFKQEGRMEETKKVKRLTPKQKHALELLTSGTGMTYKMIAETVGINPKTLWDWRNEPEFTHFQEELKRLNDERWMATVDAAREAAYRLVQADNQKMVEFVLKNEGYNPSTKVEADITTDITINIEEQHYEVQFSETRQT